MKKICKDNQSINYLEILNSSPLFYFSAGSKELFHTDFLYWLAKSHWNIFIRVMRNLAGLKDDEEFVWEEPREILEVKREHNHFDLSILRFEEDKWVPVLVLENKVKSLPSAEQLEKYSADAEKEWKGKENNGKNLIIFILISLTDATSLCTDSLRMLWAFKKYADLADALEINLSKFRMKSFNKQLCKEYCRFIRALSGLGEQWQVDASNCYLARICPAALGAEDKKKYWKECAEDKLLNDLRLNDVWQKVSFDNLRILLEEELSKANISFEHFKREKNGVMPGFYLATGYTNDTGLIELRYVLENHPFKDDPVSVLIQIQGKQYRYAVTAEVIEEGNRNVNPCWDCLNDKVKAATKKKIINWVTQKPISGNNSWCHYGKSFIYRYKHIEPSDTINDVINEVVQDAKDILKIFGVKHRSAR